VKFRQKFRHRFLYLEAGKIVEVLRESGVGDRRGLFADDDGLLEDKHLAAPGSLALLCGRRLHREGRGGLLSLAFDASGAATTQKQPLCGHVSLYNG